jgi:hypothetical protein
MASITAYITVKCPKCGRAVDISHETAGGGTVACPATVTIVCPWNRCAHSWEETLPGNFKAVNRHESILEHPTS